MHGVIRSIGHFSWALCAFFVASPALAQDPAATPLPASMTTLVTVSALAAIPFLFMTTTSFVKISVVFSILRNAIGTGQVPSGTIIAGLAAILTLYVMAPVAERMAAAAGPTVETIDPQNPWGDFNLISQAFNEGVTPLKDFLERNAGERERNLFLDLARQSNADDAPREVGARDLFVLLPAFLITELTEAFQIGFLIFLPFLVIDLVISNILMSLGMHMLSPTQISMPFKLLLFVMVDGWYLLARALILGYA